MERSTFPEYSEGYMRYLNDNGPMRPNFMTLHQYGPYFIDDNELVEKVSATILTRMICG